MNHDVQQAIYIKRCVADKSYPRSDSYNEHDYLTLQPTKRWLRAENNSVTVEVTICRLARAVTDLSTQ
jgi:hypothetical protein